MPTCRTTITIDNPVLGGTGTNTWHARTSSIDPEDNDALDGITTILLDFYSTMEAVLPGGTVIRFSGEWVSIGSDPLVLDGSDPWTVTVAGATESLPPANAICVGWRTSSASRSGKGRTFLGPVARIAGDANGTLLGDVLTSVRASAAALVDSSATVVDGALGVFSKQDGLFRDFTSSAVRDQFAVLRSRRD